MSNLAPLSVALKFGFLVVLYVFLMWVARSALRDIRGGRSIDASAMSADATGLYAGSAIGAGASTARAPRLVVERAPGHEPGMIYDLDGDIILGRGGEVAIHLDDPFASGRHARIYERGDALVIEDLGSTNGTYLNEELLETAWPLHPGDRVRIGNSEFGFEVD